MSSTSSIKGQVLARREGSEQFGKQLHERAATNRTVNVLLRCWKGDSRPWLPSAVCSEEGGSSLLVEGIAPARLYDRFGPLPCLVGDALLLLAIVPSLSPFC